MRGGAAQHFASDWLFHRGIQAEATCRMILEKATHYQRLAESRPWRAGFFCGIQGIQFVEATTPEASQRKPACHASSKQRFDPRRGAFAPRRIGSSLGRWLRLHISCAHRVWRAPGPSGLVRARWRRERKANATVGSRRSFGPVRRLRCGLTLCALSNNTDLIRQMRQCASGKGIAI